MIDNEFIEDFREKILHHIDFILNNKNNSAKIDIYRIGDLNKKELIILRDMIYSYSCCCSELIDEK